MKHENWFPWILTFNPSIHNTIIAEELNQTTCNIKIAASLHLSPRISLCCTAENMIRLSIYECAKLSKQISLRRTYLSNMLTVAFKTENNIHLFIIQYALCPNIQTDAK